MNKAIFKFWHGLISGHFANALIALVLVLVLKLASPSISPLHTVSFSLLMLIIAYAASRVRFHLYIAIALITPAVIFDLIAGDNMTLIWLSVTFAAAALTFVTGVILKAVVSHKTVTADTVAGAICAYILIGYTFGLINCAIFIQDQSAFSVAQVHIDHFQTIKSFDALLSYMLYYSFVTMTTLGYGDIFPVSAPARGLAMLEATLGQLFLAVFIARLVGVMIVSKQNEIDNTKT